MSLLADPGHRDFYGVSCPRVLEFSVVCPHSHIPSSLAGFQPAVPFYGPHLVVLVPRGSARVTGSEGGGTSAPPLPTLAATVSGFWRSAFIRELDTEHTLVNAPRKWPVLL